MRAQLLIIHPHFLIPCVAGFHVYSSRRKISNIHTSSRRYLQDSPNQADIDALRKSLEKTWESLQNTSNSSLNIPANSKDAAIDAADSLMRELEKKILKNPYTPHVFSIQLLLPSLDITNGPNMYDDVAAVDFCIELSKAIQEKKALDTWYNHKKDVVRPHNMAIFVRDDPMVKSIERVLVARGKLATDTSKKAEISHPTADTMTEFYDDFSDASSSRLFQSNIQSSADETSSFRLTSLFGDQRISNGPDMTNDVVQVISNHNVNEDIILIICPVSPAEMIAVRKMIQDYGDQKIILLFNEKLDPWPLELRSCEVIYSILPLIASSTDESRLMQTRTADTANSSRKMKLVLMRKVEDWELFIDVDGEGFQLAAAISAQATDKKGPSMEWIAKQVKDFIKKL